MSDEFVLSTTPPTEQEIDQPLLRHLLQVAVIRPPAVFRPQPQEISHVLPRVVVGSAGKAGDVEIAP